MTDSLLKFFTEQENRLLAEFLFGCQLKDSFILLLSCAVLHEYLQHSINEWKVVEFSPATE